MSFVGPRAKIDRAIEHREAFEAGLDEWLSHDPITVRRDEDAEGWTCMFYVEREAAPIRLGAVFADLVNNLESALDLLVAQLVLASGHKVSSGNYFPVVTRTDADSWGRAKANKLKGVRDDWAEGLRRFQPFNDPTPELHPLALLHLANKISKHHLLMPVALTTIGWEPSLQLNRAAREGEYAESELFEHQGHFTDGTLLGRVRAVSAAGDLKIVGWAKVPIAMKIGIGFQGFPGSGSGDDRLPDFVAFVTAIVDEVEQVVSG